MSRKTYESPDGSKYDGAMKKPAGWNKPVWRMKRPRIYRLENINKKPKLSKERNCQKSVGYRKQFYDPQLE